MLVVEGDPREPSSLEQAGDDRPVLSQPWSPHISLYRAVMSPHHHRPSRSSGIPLPHHASEGLEVGREIDRWSLRG